MAEIFPGYYALVQFCPNDAREEFANVGIAVISPSQKSSVVLSGRGPFANTLIQNSPLHDSGATLVIDGFIEKLRKVLEEEPSYRSLSTFARNGANPVSLGRAREVTLRHIGLDADRLLRRLVL